jgi:outer membrane protein OmpA-like peptidoglycan-associated protein
MKGHFRCGTGDIRCPNATRRSFWVDESWSCPHQRPDCTLKLQAVPWRNRHPSAFLLLARLLPLAALLGIVAWLFWPDFQLRSALKIKHEADALVAQSLGGTSGALHQQIADLEHQVAEIGPSEDAKVKSADLQTAVGSLLAQIQATATDQSAPGNDRIQALTAEAEALQKEIVASRNSQAAAVLQEATAALQIIPLSSSERRTQFEGLSTRAGALNGLCQRLSAIVEIWSETVAVSGADGIRTYPPKEIDDIRSTVDAAAGQANELEVLDNAEARLGLNASDTQKEPATDRPSLADIAARLAASSADIPTNPANRCPEIVAAAEGNLKRADLHALIASRRRAIAEQWQNAPRLFTVAAPEDLADKLALPLVEAFLRQQVRAEPRLVSKSSAGFIVGVLTNGEKAVVDIRRVTDLNLYQSMTNHGTIALGTRLPTSSEIPEGGVAAQVVALDGVALVAAAPEVVLDAARAERNVVLPSEQSGDAWLLPTIDASGLGKGWQSVNRANLSGAAGLQTAGGDRAVGLCSYSSYSRAPSGKALLSVQADEDTPSFAPSPFTISTEDYKFSLRILSAHPAKAPDESVLEFARFAAGPAGQAVVAASGFVDLTPRMGDDKPYPPIPANARRLSPSLRFEFGKSDLDLKARDDLERIVRKIGGPDLQRQNIYLAGHTDNVGTPAYNKILSLERAAQVEKELSSRGIKRITAGGFGQDYPVDSNASEAGRQKNRRVEIWVSP